MNKKAVDRFGSLWPQAGGFAPGCLGSGATGGDGDAAAELSRSASVAGHTAVDPWQRNLEVVGAEIFLRYRKRLLVSGIVWEIRSDYPGLSIPDVLFRVHAARTIIREGDDFRAMEAIRSGQWERIRQKWERQPLDSGARRDWVSRLLVSAGGVLFYGFCLLVALASMTFG